MEYRPLANTKAAIHVAYMWDIEGEMQIPFIVCEGVVILFITSKPEKWGLFKLETLMSFKLNFALHIVFGFCNITQYLD